MLCVNRELAQEAVHQGQADAVIDLKTSHDGLCDECQD